ncbi:hypothetical protein, partial [Phocaeicola vulgatus]|uniref:hypothetical protein n=1 Tax=Phocaeicola vulgatus TaxID=821 RepID=UPI001E318F8A
KLTAESCFHLHKILDSVEAIEKKWFIGVKTTPRPLQLLTDILNTQTDNILIPKRQAELHFSLYIVFLIFGGEETRDY